MNFALFTIVFEDHFSRNGIVLELNHYSSLLHFIENFILLLPLFLTHDRFKRNQFFYKGERKKIMDVCYS